MPSFFNLSSHRHSGRLIPHHHTSYAALALILLATGVLLAGVSGATLADTQSGSLVVSAIVPGPAPPTAPTIDDPQANQTFSTTPVHVDGTCIAGLIVKVTRNNSFAGSALCDGNNQFNLLVDLDPGRSDLVTRQYDTLDQSSPASPTVTVFYQPPASASQSPTTASSSSSPASSQSAASAAPLVVQVPYSRQGVFPGQYLALPITISGGQAPYALSVSWGDGASDLISRPSGGAYSAQHVYKKAGAYTIVVQVSDAGTQHTYIQIVAIVNGPVGTPIARTVTGLGNLAMAWPIYGFGVTLLASFWLGERFERRLLAKTQQ